MATRRSYSTAAAPTTLTVGVDNAVTSITVQDGSTYVDGTSGPSVLTIDRGKSNEERILYTSRVGNTFSGLTRGYNGTAAQSHTAGAIVEHTSTQQDFDEANAHVADATRNDHTQYARVAAANTFTAAQAFSSTLSVTGIATLLNATNNIGRGAAGAANAYAQIGDDANGALIAAKHGTAANTSLTLQALGTGSTVIQRADGTALMTLIGIAMSGNQSSIQVNFNGTSRTLEIGAADSAGAGFRYVRVAN